MVMNMVEPLKMSYGTLYHVALDQSGFGECIVSIFRGPCVDRVPQLCHHGNTVIQPLHTRIILMVEEHCLLGCFHGSIN
jgi:hypothetical protein